MKLQLLLDKLKALPQEFMGQDVVIDGKTNVGFRYRHGVVIFETFPDCSVCHNTGRVQETQEEFIPGTECVIDIKRSAPCSCRIR